MKDLTEEQKLKYLEKFKKHCPELKDVIFKYNPNPPRYDCEINIKVTLIDGIMLELGAKKASLTAWNDLVTLMIKEIKLCEDK